MEPENRHLEDFFRKKLSEPSPEGDGWDRPNPAVWAGAQAQLSPTPTAAGVFSMWQAIAAVGLVLVLANVLVGGIFQQRKVGVLEEALASQQAQIHSLENALNAQPSNSAPVLSVDPKPDPPEQAQIERLQKELLYMRRQIADLQPPDLPPTPQPKLPIAPNRPSNALNAVLNQTFLLSLSEPDPKEFASMSTSEGHIIPAPHIASRQKPAFEVGFTTGFMRLQAPNQYAFNDLRTVRDNSKISQNSFSSIGLRAGLLLSSRWSLQMGVRTSSGTLSRSSEFQVAYNTRNEYERPDGTIANDLTLKTKDGYRNQERTLTMSIPADRRLQDNNLLDVVIDEKQDIRIWQVPIGMQYAHPIGRWKITWQAGLQANLFSFGDQQTQAAILFGDAEIPTERKEIPSERFPLKASATPFIGAGINYQIFGDWALHTQVQYSHHPATGSTAEFRRQSSADQSLTMSLLYTF